MTTTIPIVLSLDESEAKDFAEKTKSGKIRHIVATKISNAIDNHIATRDEDFYALMSPRWTRESIKK